MKSKKPSITLLLDTRREKYNNRYPLKLTLYYQEKKKRYNIGIDLSIDEWKKINQGRLKEDRLKEIKHSVNTILGVAQEILSKLKTFSFEGFEAAFFGNADAKVNDSLAFYFELYIKDLEKQERIGTLSSYNTTIRSLLAFRPNLKLGDINQQFLEAYEWHMTQGGKSPSTIGIYLRQLRAIINRAIRDGAISREQYPFKGYSIPSSRNIKKALKDDDIKRVLEFQAACDKIQIGVDYWVFSYLCNGMNFTDIAFLTDENVSGDFIHYIRQKTRRTKKKDLRPIKVVLLPKAKEIIKRRGNQLDRGNYLFPILDIGLSARTRRNRIQRFIKFVNSQMEIVRKELGIDQKVGTYVARHTFSTRLKRKGASTQLIKESLGHSSIITTESYLDDFPDDVKIEYSKMLTDF